MRNGDYYHSQEAIKEIVDRLGDTDCSLGIFGSAIYGKANGYGVKPNGNSDIDTNLVVKRDLPIKNLEGLLNPVPGESLDLFQGRNVDILALRGNYEGRPILFQCMDEETFQRITHPDSSPVIMYKERKDKKKKVRPFYDSPIFGLNKIGKDTTRIIPLEEGNLIVYNNINFPQLDDFYLTVQQRQILTQEELIDKESYLSQQRLLLQERLKSQFPEEDLMGFFNRDVSEWSEDFRKKMESRLK